MPIRKIHVALGDFSALKGHNMPAQGNALGFVAKRISSPVRATPDAQRGCDALTGLVVLALANPGRCPGLACAGPSGVSGTTDCGEQSLISKSRVIALPLPDERAVVRMLHEGTSRFEPLNRGGAPSIARQGAAPGDPAERCSTLRLRAWASVSHPTYRSPQVPS